ncbi:unnamed protein product [Somion occarium]|uniref:NAD(P)-binding protein n=1 Tax=Somion occarium TaxID=3059160 RepID=A0ABP1E6X8_9APHY
MTMAANPQIFTFLGILTTAYFLRRLVSFIWLYYLRPSSVNKFIYGKEPYALITGASDGIGRATALELYEKGFNLILHGRNEAKLTKVISEIKATAKGPSRDIKYFIASADSPEVDFQKIADEFRQLKVTLLINNVGGSNGLRSEKVDGYDETELLCDIRINALFPFYLTRAFLPQLRSTGGPVEVIFVGSQSADIAIPRLYTYAPSKAFLHRLACCLNSDEQFWTPSNVRFVYWNVGTVVTNSLRETPGLFYPLAAKFAKSAVARIGCGKERVTPYAPHAFQQFFVGLLPESFLLKYAADTMKKLIEGFEKRVD